MNILSLRIWPEARLIRMTAEVAEILFRVLSQDGIVMRESFLLTLYTIYIEKLHLAIEHHHILSLINGLSHDRHESSLIVNRTTAGGSHE